MPSVRANGVALYYETSGSGAESVLMAHGLLMDQRMWDAQRAALAGRYRVIAYDHRGQGRSQARGPYDMETLTVDAVALLHALDAAPCHFVGLSMGGFVGLRLAARHPELLRSLTLLDSSAEREPAAARRRFWLMTLAVRLVGVAPLIPQVLPLMFGTSTRADPAQAALVSVWATRLRALPRRIVRPVQGVIRRRDVTAELATIRCPALVVVGEEDKTTPPHRAERIAAGIAGSRLVRLPRCGHSSALEAPAAVNRLLLEFLATAH